MSAASVRIVLVEDQQMLAELVCLHCQAIPGYEVAGVSATAAGAVESIPHLQPDVVLLDLGLPDRQPQEVVKAVLSVAGCAKVIAFTSLLNPVTLRLVEEWRLPGYLDKLSGGILNLKEAITTVLAGRVYRPAWFRAKVEEVRAMPDTFVNVLSEREQEVLALIGDSLSDAQIGAKLGLSERTGLAYRSRIMDKVNRHSTPELIHYAIENGFTVPGQGGFWRGSLPAAQAARRTPVARI